MTTNLQHTVQLHTSPSYFEIEFDLSGFAHEEILTVRPLPQIQDQWQPVSRVFLDQDMT